MASRAAIASARSAPISTRCCIDEEEASFDNGCACDCACCGGADGIEAMSWAKGFWAWIVAFVFVDGGGGAEGGS